MQPMKIAYSRRADKALQAQPAHQREVLLARIEQLAANPRDPALNVRPLAGSVGLFRLRIGEYRAVFSLDRAADTLTIELIRTRGDVYKR